VPILCNSCEIKTNLVDTSNMRIYIYHSGSSVMPFLVTCDNSEIGKCLVLGAVLELTLSSAVIKSGLPSISDLLEHP